MSERGRRERPASYRSFSADGHAARWERWRLPDERTPLAEAVEERLTLRWENEAWTASGIVGSDHVQYVIRISPIWQVRQFLLFRDLEEPDLWLGSDGNGRWGEVNGDHRPELDGCVDIDLACTPFTNTLPIRRLALDVGGSADILVAMIDVETLDVQPDPQRYTRLAAHRWRFEQKATGFSAEFDVDPFGLVRDYPTLFRRLD
ncbi:MAG: putative glycolipid-binding domain-containing protein [Ilumatobacteraceae bacterium]